MKLLIDQNISHRIIQKIGSSFDIIRHVKDIGLYDENDCKIFIYARENQYDGIITIDEDFVKLVDAFSIPPKIIWVRTGNCSTDFLANLLNNKSDKIKAFLNNPEFSIYEILK